MFDNYRSAVREAQSRLTATLAAQSVIAHLLDGRSIPQEFMAMRRVCRIEYSQDQQYICDGIKLGRFNQGRRNEALEVQPSGSPFKRLAFVIAAENDCRSS